VLVTGGSGVLGRALLPLLADHDVRAPARNELDLFDAVRVEEAVAEADAIFHLATRIPPREHWSDRDAWRENDRLRRDASRLLVDGALSGRTKLYVQPSVTFVGEVPPQLESALAAEREAARFADAGRRGVVLRFGRLDGPGTFYETPSLDAIATLHVDDAGAALLAALDAHSGVYNVARDGGRVSNARFKRVTGWRPELYPKSSTSTRHFGLSGDNRG
jgi:nucleoside-diphosphate-sugar epimerase